MANEIQASAGLVVSKNGTTISFSNSQQVTLAGVGMETHVQTIGNGASELLAFPSDLTTEGVSYYAVKNLDATNYVELALENTNTQKFAKLLPGGVCLIPSHAANPGVYARANAAPCNVQIAASGT
jgi:predicted methyltransferase